MKLTTIVATVLSAIVTTAIGAAPPASAASVIDEWTSVKAPPPPEVKPVTIDAKTTALLLLDFVNPNCTRRHAAWRRYRR